MLDEIFGIRKTKFFGTKSSRGLFIFQYYGKFCSTQHKSLFFWKTLHFHSSKMSKYFFFSLVDNHMAKTKQKLMLKENSFEWDSGFSDG